MPKKIRKLFTDEEIKTALYEAKGDCVEAAASLTALGRADVSRQLVRYWKKHLSIKKQNGDTYIGTTVIDRRIRDTMKLRQPEQGEYFSTSKPEGSNNSILFIPDLHAPYHHQDAIAFLRAVKEKYQPDLVINAGDEVDNHALSFHDSDPNLDSAGVELHKAQRVMAELEELFPVMHLMDSNHGSLVYRRALKCGIPVDYIKSYRDILFPNGGGSGWTWHDSFKVQLPDGSNLLCAHHMAGDPITQGARNHCSVALGHLHSKFDITFSASDSLLWFAMRAGCLIDRKSLAFAYGKLSTEKPILGCGVIVNSLPKLIPMLLDDSGRWVGYVN